MSESVKVPFFDITLRGKPLDEYRMSMIEDIVYEDNATGSDLLTIQLKDPDLKLLSDDIFVKECPVTFVGGWLKGDVVTFEGFISVIDMNFPRSQVPKITIHCMDNTHVMNLKKHKRTWEDTKMSEVAKRIFRSYGMTAVVDDTGDPEENISQDDTDIKFLIKQAEKQYENFICYVEGHTGYFVKKKTLENPQATLSYRQGEGNLLSFSPRINKQSKKVEVGKAEVNLKDNAVDKAETNDTLARPVSGSTVKPSDKVSNQQVQWKFEDGKWVKK